MTNLRQPLSAIAAALLLAGPMHAQDTPRADRQDALAGQRMWDAFACAHYAIYAHDEAETGRLFDLGLSEGRRFLDAMQRGDVSREDIYREVPVAVTFRLQGPTNEFILGRIWEGAADYVGDELYGPNRGSGEGDRMLSQEALRISAEARANERSCRSLR